jgi:hypothetical protein
MQIALLKSKMQNLYYKYKSTLALNTGDKVSVSREHLVEWMEEASGEIESSQAADSLTN